jgi:hypothetical protein
MARMNISIPEKLKSRMDELNINWSGVAQRAFEKEILAMEAQQKAEDISGVVARLQASKAVTGERASEQGKGCGRSWAMQRAKYPQLKGVGVSLTNKEIHINDELAYLVGRLCVSSHENDLLDDIDNRDIEDFWEDWLGSRSPDPDAVFGFFHGAREVWDEVKDQV